MDTAERLFISGAIFITLCISIGAFMLMISLISWIKALLVLCGAIVVFGLIYWVVRCFE
jgi:hypothetical protein